MIKWADTDAHRTAVVITEIGETKIVFNIGDLSIAMIKW